MKDHLGDHVVLLVHSRGVDGVQIALGDVIALAVGIDMCVKVCGI